MEVEERGKDKSVSKSSIPIFQEKKLSQGAVNKNPVVIRSSHERQQSSNSNFPIAGILRWKEESEKT